MSYGANYADTFGRAAYFVDRILKGAKPAELPVEQPARVELTINLRTAKSPRPDDPCVDPRARGSSDPVKRLRLILELLKGADQLI